MNRGTRVDGDGGSRRQDPRAMDRAGRLAMLQEVLEGQYALKHT